MKCPRHEPLVYAMVCPKAAAIKIGMSVDPMSRLGGLSTPDWLFLWETWEGGRSEEHRAHEVLREHRIRREWFSAHPEVIAFVCDQAGHPDMAEAVRADFTVAGHLMTWVCRWAALLDEDEGASGWEDAAEADDEDEGAWEAWLAANVNEGVHLHGKITVAGQMHGWAPTPRGNDILLPGLRWGPGPLEAELWTNDVGSEYWVMRNPIVGAPTVIPPRRRRGPKDTPDQLRLLL